MTMQNPFLGFLDANPEATYYSYEPQWGQGQTQRNYYRGQYSDMYNRYRGWLGTQARGGTMPMGSLNDYLGGYDWNKGYQENQTYTQRNPDFSAFRPNLQWRVR